MGGENGWEGNGEGGASDGWAGDVGLIEGLLYVVAGGAAGWVSSVPHFVPMVSSAFQTYFVPQWVPRASPCWVSPLWRQWGRNDWKL